MIQSLVGQKYTSLVNANGAKYRSLPRPVVEILVRKDIFRENLPQYIAENVDINAAMGAAAGMAGADAGVSISSEYLYYILTSHQTYRRRWSVGIRGWLGKTTPLLSLAYTGDSS